MSATPSERTRVRRLPARGDYERETLDAILDEALVSHLGLVRDGGPLVIPTLHARAGNRVLVHGSAASATLRAMKGGVEVCLTATLVDELVLARSAFHHSVNYRSAVVRGRARVIEDPDERRDALRAFIDRLMPGRWDDVRGPSVKELKATAVLELPIEEFSAKIRSGPPVDEDVDMELDCWAGVVPLRRGLEPPRPDAALRPGIPEPGYIKGFPAA